jgi:predicted GNAT superfamily acetyltransferase
MTTTIRDANPRDFEAICALNRTEEQHTSPMDGARLDELHSLASYHRVACIDGEVAAFLLAMREDAPYRNDNFEWFRPRFPCYLYVDRIVVSEHFRGLRLGALLYDDLFRFARITGVPAITCEYNIMPPNEPSRRFHHKYGFEEQGTQWVAGGRKQVSLQVARVASALD